MHYVVVFVQIRDLDIVEAHMQVSELEMVSCAVQGRSSIVFVVVAALGCTQCFLALVVRELPDAAGVVLLSAAMRRPD